MREFRFATLVRNQETFLCNTGPILSLDSPNWNRRQFYSVSRGDARGRVQLADWLPCPPCRTGPLSTPDYPALADAAVRTLPGSRRVFAGQRPEGFYVDLGAIFDLLDPRPFADLHNHFGLVVAIELRALAGATYALVDRTFTPDPAAAQVDDGVTPSSLDIPYLNRFPYLGVPNEGFTTPSS